MMSNDALPLERLYVAHGVEAWDDLVVVVPHQMPPRLVDRTQSPPDPDAGDSLVAGDHDAHASMTLTDAIGWTGHRRHAVAALIADAIAAAKGE